MLGWLASSIRRVYERALLYLLDPAWSVSKPNMITHTRRSSSTLTNSTGNMGRYIHGFHFRTANFQGFYNHTFGGGSALKIAHFIPLKADFTNTTTYLNLCTGYVTAVIKLLQQAIYCNSFVAISYCYRLFCK